MLARCNNVKHPNSDFPIDLPLLIPSFTSKGFGEARIKGKLRSEIVAIYETFAGQHVGSAFLISAYDMYHHYIKAEREFPNKEVVFIDSGGYELCREYDSTEVKHRRTRAGRSRKTSTFLY